MYLRRRVDGESQLGLLAIVNRQALQQERSKTRSSTTSNSVEDQETLKACTVVCQLADTVQAQVYNLFADSVVTTGEVVGGILLARDKLLRVEQLTVGASSDLVNDSGLQAPKRSQPTALSGKESLPSQNVKRHLGENVNLTTRKR